METVTVIGVFVIVVTTVVNLYLTYSRSHRQSGQRQKITAAAAVLLDEIARDVRNYEIAYWGTLDYNGLVAGGPNTLYELDVAGGADCEGQCSYKTDIYRDEWELVLYDNGGDEPVTNDKIIAYVFLPSGYPTDLCVDDTGPTPGLYRFYKEGTNNIYCQRLFDFPGASVVSARFVFTQPFNPYPDAVDSATDISSSRDTDCGTGTYASSTGYFCRCTAGGQANDCYSGVCDTATGGAGTPGHCTFGENRHPAVTVYFTVQDANIPGSSLTFQTTASQRLYKR